MIGKTICSYLLIPIFSLVLAQSQGHLYDEIPIDKEGPFATVYNPENNPEDYDRKFFPPTFKMAYESSAHNTAYPVNGDAPGWIKEGVNWRFKEARAWPLEKEKPFAEEVYGPSRSLATITQWVGNALNVAAVDGVIYAESDDMFVYAINAKTGKLIWRSSPVNNTYMGTPLVVGDKVYIHAGAVAFTFHQTIVYKQDELKSARGAGVSYNGIIALDKKTGEFEWMYSVKGEVMPTPAYWNGKIIFSTGDGYIYAIDSETGKEVWFKDVGGMGNMSNPMIYKDKVYLSMAVVSKLFCLDAKNGEIIWSGTIPEATNTGMGDVTPAVDDGVVVMNSVIAPEDTENGTTMNTRVRAFDAETGEVLWTKDMGRGPKPQSFKGGVPLIHKGVIYLGNPVTNKFFAMDLKTGDTLWDWKVPYVTPAGVGRGPATYYKNTLYIATGAYIYALNPETGKKINEKKIGGKFPIMSPTIVGGTIYLGNAYDWVIAVPVSEVNPEYKP